MSKGEKMEKKLRELLEKETDPHRICEIHYRLFVFETLTDMKKAIAEIQKMEEITKVMDAINMLCSIMTPLGYDKYLMLASRLDPYEAKAASNGDNENYSKLLEKRYVLVTNVTKAVRCVDDFKCIATKNLLQFANLWWSYRQDIVCKL